MTSLAVFIMIVTILLVWGGLVASVVLLQVLPSPQEEDNVSLMDSTEERVADTN